MNGFTIIRNVDDIRRSIVDEVKYDLFAQQSEGSRSMKFRFSENCKRKRERICSIAAAVIIVKSTVVGCSLHCVLVALNENA